MTDDMIIPDVPQTRLAWRVWGLDKRTLTLTSTTPAGISKADREKQSHAHPLLAGLMDPLGAWPKPSEASGLLQAHCHAGGDHDGDEWIDAHTVDGRVASPGPECNSGAGHGCGIYSTTDLSISTRYLSRDHPVMGLVELGGRVLDCEQGFRAEWARVAAIILLPKCLSPLSEGMHQKIAAAYEVPFITDPAELDPEKYRELIDPETAEAQAEAGIADEVENFLRDL